MTLAFERISTWDKDFVSEIRRHYTRSRGAPPGKKMAWAVYEDGRRIAYIGLSEPAFKLAPRRRLGLMDARPLDRTVCCFIYRSISDHACKGSDILKEWHRVACRDWSSRYGWEPVHWETMVLPSAIQSEVPGACFRRAGYRSLGYTTGRSVRRPAGHTHRSRVWSDSEPKLVLYRGPLARVQETVDRNVTRLGYEW